MYFEDAEKKINRIFIDKDMNSELCVVKIQALMLGCFCYCNDYCPESQLTVSSLNDRFVDLL